MQVFLEPEGRTTPELYVQGFSTGLPERLQLALLHTLPGALPYPALSCPALPCPVLPLGSTLHVNLSLPVKLMAKHCSLLMLCSITVLTDSFADLRHLDMRCRAGAMQDVAACVCSGV